MTYNEPPKLDEGTSVKVEVDSNKVEDWRNGYKMAYTKPFQCNCKQWLRIFLGINFTSIFAFFSLVLLIAFTPIYMPMFIFAFRGISTHTNCKHERCDKVSMWIYNYFRMKSDKRFWVYTNLRLLCITGLLNKIKKNEELHIVSWLGSFFGIETKVRDFTDFHFFLNRALSYYLHEYECMLRMEFGTPRKDLYSPSAAECKASIVHNIFGPMAHQTFEVEGRVGEWRVDFPDYVNAHHWCKMNCKAIGLKYLPAVSITSMTREEVLAALMGKPLNMDEWSVEVFLSSASQRECFFEAEKANHAPAARPRQAATDHPFQNDGDESKAHTDEYALRCAVQRIATALPTIWHSWIHFPTQDLISVWVSQQQARGNTATPFFKVAWVHTICTKYNSQLVKELGRPTNTTFDPMAPTSSTCTAVPMNQGAFLYNTALACLRELNKTRPANMGPVPSLPYMKHMQDGMAAFAQFVEKSWPHLGLGAVHFIEFVHQASRGQMDFREPLERQQAFITRVLFSQTFHFADHSFMAMNVAKHPSSFTSLTPEMLAEDYLWGDNWHWITQKFKDCQPKVDNFGRMFADYSYQKNSTPTHSTFDYKVPELNELQKELKSGLKKAVEGLCADAGSVFEGYVDADRLGKYAPVSIDH